MNQLGMKYARKDQVVYYSVESSNYMNQYNSIPEKQNIIRNIRKDIRIGTRTRNKNKKWET